jgi:hypothetical protein
VFIKIIIDKNNTVTIINLNGIECNKIKNIFYYIFNGLFFYIMIY